MSCFRFKQFSVEDDGCAMKVGTDSVLLGAWANVESARTVADLGAGSGLLALMIAQRTDKARIKAIEIDAEACAAAAANIAASPWSTRIDAVNADVTKYSFCEPVDLIICNPPYFVNALASPDYARSKARNATSFGALEAVRIAAEWLSAAGSLAMIAPHDLSDDIIFESEMLRLQICRQCDVTAVAGRKPTRTLWQIARKTTHHVYERTSITIRDTEGLTPEFKALTQNFYL